MSLFYKRVSYYHNVKQAVVKLAHQEALFFKYFGQRNLTKLLKLFLSKQLIMHTSADWWLWRHYSLTHISKKYIMRVRIAILYVLYKKTRINYLHYFLLQDENMEAKSFISCHLTNTMNENEGNLVLCEYSSFEEG